MVEIENISSDRFLVLNFFFFFIFTIFNELFIMMIELSKRTKSLNKIVDIQLDLTSYTIGNINEFVRNSS